MTKWPFWLLPRGLHEQTEEVADADRLLIPRLFVLPLALSDCDNSYLANIAQQCFFFCHASLWVRSYLKLLKHARACRADAAYETLLEIISLSASVVACAGFDATQPSYTCLDLAIYQPFCPSSASSTYLRSSATSIAVTGKETTGNSGPLRRCTSGFQRPGKRRRFSLP
ncbi:hypothetical protein AOQ84DRAFT_167018 [Glonium stellatum]|uniref:Uncharacterized protein n=1 Tax=Glonium stellatum TaxID=574774 RepID=A0A8E2EQN2_9PEZI|nr:hypothetical protein AOQ84DRAFT_167018 [Glonium stellatum]